jgi:hypothetical protein
MFENGCFLRRQKRFKLPNKVKPERPRKGQRGLAAGSGGITKMAEKKAAQQRQQQQQQQMMAAASTAATAADMNNMTPSANSQSGMELKQVH